MFSRKEHLAMAVYCAMYSLRRHKLSLVGLLMITALVYITTIIYTRDTNGKENFEERRKQCGIAICTACQFVEDDHKRDLLDSYANSGFDASLHKTFPPPITKNLETLPSSGIYRIERTIHQSWKTSEVPMQFKSYIESFIKNHPSWEYMFWTDKLMRDFIKEHYPNLLSLYDNYSHPLNRPDAMRYVMLFHYGGVYSDLDILSLHPLDPMVKKYSCFLGQEPHAHSIIYSNFYEQASNALMACRKRHPFMKSVIENLFHFYYFSDVLDSTGPRFLTFSLRQYVSKTINRDISDDDYVYLAPPEYFLPTVDPEMNDKLTLLCGGFSCLSALRQWQCDQWKKVGLRSEPYSFSFTNHVWAHTAYNAAHFLFMQTINIYRIFPNATQYYSNHLRNREKNDPQIF